MKPDDLMWNIFCTTGRIGDYLLYNELTKRDDDVPDKNKGACSSQLRLR